MMEKKMLCIIHFNDVYELEDRKIEPAGGASRFSWLVDYIRKQTLHYPLSFSSSSSATTDASSSSSPSVTPSMTCLTLFSGDALSPSLLSTVTRGRHMIEVLNTLQVDVACIGNHDEDFGPSTFVTVANETKFPWLLSNVKLKDTKQCFDGTKEYYIYESTDKLWRIGFMGIWEYDCLATLATIDTDVLEFEAPVEAGQRLVQLFKEQYNCNCIIALTHMRKHNDDVFATSVEGIDILLGGHDHECMVEMHNGITPSIKSGSDFRNVSHILMSNTSFDTDLQSYWTYFQQQRTNDNLSALVQRDLGTVTSPAHGYRVSARQYDITSLIPYHDDMHRIVKKYMDVLGKQMEGIIGLTRVPLDARFSIIRTQESNIGNFITDIIRQVTEADVVILNSGTLRADSVLGPGVLLMKHLVSLLPLQDPIVTIKLSGALLLKILENSVSQYPKLEGRFAQVSGIRFSFDPNCPPGSRIVPASVVILRSTIPPSSAVPSSSPPLVPVVVTESKDDDDTLSNQPSLSSSTSHSSFPVLQKADSFTTLDEILTDSEETDPDEDTEANNHHHHSSSSSSSSVLSIPPPRSLHKVATEPITLADLHTTTRTSTAVDHDLDPTLLNPVARTATSAITNTSGTKVAMLRVRSTGDILETDSSSSSSSTVGIHRTGSVPLSESSVRNPSVPLVTWEPLDLTKTYKLSTKAYLLDGRDGYDMFLDPSIEILVDSEGGPILPVIIRNHFRVLAGLAGLGNAANEVKPFVGNDTVSSSSVNINSTRKVRANSGDSSPISIASSDTVHESTLSLTKRLLPAMNTVRKVLTSPGTGIGSTSNVHHLHRTDGATPSSSNRIHGADDTGFLPSPSTYTQDASVQSLTKAFDPIMVSPSRVHDPTMTPVEEEGDDEAAKNVNTTTLPQTTLSPSVDHVSSSSESVTFTQSRLETKDFESTEFVPSSPSGTANHSDPTGFSLRTTLKATQSASDLLPSHHLRSPHHNHHHRHHHHHSDETIVEHTMSTNDHHPATPSHPQHRGDDRRAWTEAREKWRRVIEGRSTMIKNNTIDKNTTPSKLSSSSASHFAIAIAPVVDGRIHIVNSLNEQR